MDGNHPLFSNLVVYLKKVIHRNELLFSSFKQLKITRYLFVKKCIN